MKRNTNSVSDSIRPYLEEISERLWNGRATVMIGAGFSKNAGPQFPDWNQLGDHFYEKAHGYKPDSNKEKYLNVLRLAEEVEAVIGRPALQDFIRSIIPDKNIDPSPLHVALLELPWADVFTTNYDTLLERASEKVITRRYETVVNKEDIPYASKPRIVKLHGSFHSKRPFIITEEDYRRYSLDNAPFVNTVQQALLENTLCLIGFSGDDPNFLKWIGWIRDNLGKDKTQKIYLVGVFEMSSARRNLLVQRGINVVDFSCCHGINNEDHKKALRCFIDYLRSKQTVVLDWPGIEKSTSPNYMDKVNREEEMKRITQVWQNQRLLYPGWLILPHSNRENLWDNTRLWVEFFRNKGSLSLQVGLDIKYIYELIWRIDRCLLPIHGLSEECRKVLEKYWPFNIGNPSKNCQYIYSEVKFQDLPWDEIRQAWLAIALSMLRYYREQGLIDEWKKAETQLKNLVEFLSAEQKEFFYYEGFLFSLFTLDLIEVVRRLENWKPVTSQPYWVSKHAAAVAEIGFSNDYFENVTFSLFETRKRRERGMKSNKYLAASKEAYQMLFVRFVGKPMAWLDRSEPSPEEIQRVEELWKDEWKQEKPNSESSLQKNIEFETIKQYDNFNDLFSDIISQPSEERPKDFWKYLYEVRNEKRLQEIQQQNARWDELKSLRCDPWNELKMFELSLDRPCNKHSQITIKPEFDIGQATKKIHLGTTDPEVLNAISFLRFCEEIGLPFRIGHFSIATNIAKASLERASRYSFFWAAATLVRVGDEKAVDSVFNRAIIYRLATNVVDHLAINYLNVLKQFMSPLRNNNRNGDYELRLTQLLPEIISRLCCKCSRKVNHSILDFLKEVYASPYKTNYRGVKNLVKRLISSMTDVEQYNMVPDLLCIRFPGELNQLTKSEYPNPFPFLEISRKPDGASDLDIQEGIVDVLCNQALSDIIDERRWAISSLITLLKFKLINKHQIEKVSKALWSKKYTDKDDFPKGTDYYKFAFLNLPYPQEVDVIQLFKSHVKRTPFPIQKKGQKTKSVDILGGRIPIVHEILGANSVDSSFWTKSEAIEFFQLVKDWWDADKDELKKNDSEPDDFLSIKDEFKSRFYIMLKLVTEVICPKLSKNSSDNIITDLRRLLKETKKYGLYTLEAESASLHIYPEKKNEVTKRICKALFSKNDNIEKDGLSALTEIIFSGNYDNRNSRKNKAIEMLRQYVLWCSTNSVGSALWVIYRVLICSPTSFSDCLEDATIRRLEILVEETNYDNKYLPTFEEKLELRRITSVLTATLWKHYKSNYLPVPKIIAKWRKICLSANEFSEIRNAWDSLLKE